MLWVCVHVCMYVCVMRESGGGASAEEFLLRKTVELFVMTFLN